jgi:DNA mismatch repair protein MutS
VRAGIPRLQPGGGCQRQEIMKDIERSAIQSALRAFAKNMTAMREQLAKTNKLYGPRLKQAWFVQAVRTYGEAIVTLVDRVSTAGTLSRGLQAFLDYAKDYIHSSMFGALMSETIALQAQLTAIQYNLFIRGGAVTVRHRGTESDYREEVEALFSRFRHQLSPSQSEYASNAPEMNHVEARILDMVERLNPEPFQTLTSYCQRYRNQYVDDNVAQFDRKVQFYLAYIDFIEGLEERGLPFCYPSLVEEIEEVHDVQAFDLALAAKLDRAQRKPVLNDWELQDPERVFVVTGPNQGGKTTFARMLGQLHYLAKLGLPVPGRNAKLLFWDMIFTHFEREEVADQSGKLADDLLCVRQILDAATDRSVIILNEIFSSTTLQDARELGRRIIKVILAREALAVIVTFIPEWSELSSRMTSWVCEVDPGDPSRRTFRIVRMNPNGRSYALMIAEKYGLTYAPLKERLSS